MGKELNINVYPLDFDQKYLFDLRNKLKLNFLIKKVMSIVIQRIVCGGKIGPENPVSFHFHVLELISTETLDTSKT